MAERLKGEKENLHSTTARPSTPGNGLEDTIDHHAFGSCHATSLGQSVNHAGVAGNTPCRRAVVGFGFQPGRQGFVCIINESSESGVMHILAFDDAGTVDNPIEIPLSANQALHFNAGDLENGNTAKDIEAIGRPGRGDCA